MIAVPPRNVAALLLAAAAFCSGCDREDPTISYSTAMIKRYPENARAYNRRGVNYEQLERYEEAVADYTRAIQLQPAAPNFYFNLGNALSSQGRYQRAIAQYDQAIRLFPDDADYYNNRGLAYAKLGRYERAIKNCSAAIWLKPDDADYYHTRGAAYQQQGDTRRAEADFATARKLDPTPCCRAQSSDGWRGVSVSVAPSGVSRGHEDLGRATLPVSPAHPSAASNGRSCCGSAASSTDSR